MYWGRSVVLVSAYALQAGGRVEEKEAFYEDLMKLVWPRRERVIIMGDLSGHMGRKSDGFEEIHGNNGFGERNSEGKALLRFAGAISLKIPNTYFAKRKVIW